MHLATVEDIPEVERILNHPEVYPLIEADLNGQRIEGAPLVQATLAFMCEKGCVILDLVSDDEAEIHTNFLPEGRGLNALREMAKVIQYAFTRTSIRRIVTKVQHDNPAANWFSRRMMAQEIARDERYVYLSCDWIRWACNCPAMEEIGQAFHVEHGENVTHGEDPLHNRVVGAALETAMCGWGAKAVDEYNRWAHLAKWAPVIVLQPNPLVVSFDGHTLEIADGSFRLLSKVEA